MSIQINFSCYKTLEASIIHILFHANLVRLQYLHKSRLVIGKKTPRQKLLSSNDLAIAY